MALTNIAAAGNANVTVTDNGDVLYIRTNGAGSAKLTITSGLSGFTPIEFSGQRTISFPASGVVNIAATGGSVDYELGNGSSLGSQSIGAQPEDVLTTKQVFSTISGAPVTLTNPTYQGTNSVDNYTQISIQNKSATANSSSDHIAYPDNITNDTTGFVDIGITSSAFSQAAYAVTGANEAYLFGSAPTGAGKSGNLIIATDSTGSTNAIKFATGGFNSTANFRAQIDGSGLSVTKAGAGLNVKEGTNCKQGTATLVAGTVVVSNTSVTANSRIFLTTQSVGGTAGFLVVSARVAGTSFTILSSSGTDTSVVAYQIFEPSV